MYIHIYIIYIYIYISMHIHIGMYVFTYVYIYIPGLDAGGRGKRWAPAWRRSICTPAADLCMQFRHLLSPCRPCPWCTSPLVFQVNVRCRRSTELDCNDSKCKQTYLDHSLLLFCGAAAAGGGYSKMQHGLGIINGLVELASFEVWQRTVVEEVNARGAVCEGDEHERVGILLAWGMCGSACACACRKVRGIVSNCAQVHRIFEKPVQRTCLCVVAVIKLFVAIIAQLFPFRTATFLHLTIQCSNIFLLNVAEKNAAISRKRSESAICIHSEKKHCTRTLHACACACCTQTIGWWGACTVGKYYQE